MSGSRDGLESTLALLARARAGDEEALNDLFARFAPALRRWASGRLPRSARDLADTGDLVQEALLNTFRNLSDFEHRGAGAFHAYLRQAVMNRIRDELRKAQHRPAATAVDLELPGTEASPVEVAIGSESVERYEAALARLTAAEREVVIARVELGLTYSEIAAATGRNTANAARMAVARALIRLAEEMGERGQSPG
jgi:RNA polymerase sigma-70 factor (ECF subfamily)